MTHNNNILVAVSIFALTGFSMLGAVCVGCHQNTLVLTSEQHDSIFEEILDVNPQQALSWADSMEAVKAESQVRVAFYRAKIYNELGQKQRAEEWCDKALEGDDLQEESSELFYAASDLKIKILTYKDEFEEALETARTVFDISRSDTSPEGIQWSAVLLHELGYCQMQLGDYHEAENSFSQAYIALKQMACSSPNYDNLLTYARVSYNILDAYTSTGQLEKASEWVPSTEEAVMEFVSSPDCSEDERVDYLGGLTLQKALILVQTGHREEADALYAEVLNSDYAETALGVLERCSYLEKAGRYDDITEMMPLIDSVAATWGTPATFEHLEKYRKN
ncbi:MAG: tetratricopeptide repeat protein [Bacteroidaceae bacterium]|nr:tetratricopeptide repeat protein [Bacteroidaceae bacterium]